MGKTEANEHVLKVIENQAMNIHDDVVRHNNPIVGIFDHNLLSQQHSEQMQTAQEVFRRMSESIRLNDPNVFLIRGPMGAGKTSVSKAIATLIAETYPDRCIAFYRLNDGRATPNGVFDRNNTTLSSKVNIKLVEFGGIRTIFDDISNNLLENGSIIFLSEGQFFGNQEQLLSLAELARKRNMVLCFDCLSSWYSGIPINETQFIASQLATGNTWDLRACDSFASDERADISMRSVILKEDGTFWEDIKERESATYMNDKTQEERLRLIAFIKASTDPIIMRLKWKDPSTGEFIYLIPSHPTKDATYVLGGDERYRPTSFSTVLHICDELGLIDLKEAYSAIQQTYYTPQTGTEA